MIRGTIIAFAAKPDRCCCCAQDLVKETAAFYKKARKFYDALARQLVRQGHALDIFACSLDQVR